MKESSCNYFQFQSIRICGSVLFDWLPDFYSALLELSIPLCCFDRRGSVLCFSSLVCCWRYQTLPCSNSFIFLGSTLLFLYSLFLSIHIIRSLHLIFTFFYGNLSFIYAIVIFSWIIVKFQFVLFEELTDLM